MTTGTYKNSSFPRRWESNFLPAQFRWQSWIPVCAGITAITLGTIISSPAHADITIGVAGPMSGQYAIFGEQMVHGAQSAIDEINAKGGISGEQLKLVSGDDACDNRKTEDVAKNLVSNGAAVVIGHFCSNAALMGAKIYEAANIPMISPSASLPLLAEGAGWNVVRLASRDDVQADVAALRIKRETPDAVVARLNAEINKALSMPEVRDSLRTQGLKVAPGSVDSFAALIRSDSARYIKIAKAANLKAD